MTIDEVITMLNSEDCNLTTNICLMRYKARDCWKCILKEYTKTVYNNAIDDFAESVKNLISVSSVIRFKDIEEIAEQLKVGGENEQGV